MTLAIVIAVILTACSKTEKAVVPQKPKIKVTINKTTVSVGANVTVTISSDIEVTEDMEFKVGSNDNGIAVAAEEKLTMAKGAKKVTVEVTGVSAGETFISAETLSGDVEMTENKVGIIVREEVSVIKGSIEPFADELGIMSDVFFIISFKTKHGNFEAGELLIHFTNWEDDSEGRTLSLHNYGASFVGTNGSDGPTITAVERGADMNSLSWTDNTNYNKDEWVLSMPRINSPYMEFPLTGVVYIAFKSNLSVSGNDTVGESCRVWVKLNVEEVFEANLSNCETAVCLDNNQPFKVGQTK